MAKDRHLTRRIRDGCDSGDSRENRTNDRRTIPLAKADQPRTFIAGAARIAVNR
jgi:hypothetical protein